MESMQSTPTTEALLADPCISDSLKNMIRKLVVECRDPVDVLHDTELLARWARERVDWLRAGDYQDDGMAKFTVQIADGGVSVTQTVEASSPEDALDIIEAQIRHANAAGDYGVDREVMPPGTALSEISCGSIRRTVTA